MLVAARGRDMEDAEATKIALACQGGGSHTAYTAGVLAELAAVVDVVPETEADTEARCDRDGNRTGVGTGIGDADDRYRRGNDGESERRYELTDVSGASGGASCALVWWYGLLTGGPERARDLLETFWKRTAARSPTDHLVNDTVVGATALENGGIAFPSFSPYLSPASVYARKRLRELLTDLVDFDRIDDLAGPSRPTLHVGAVDVLEGRFRAFRDEEVDVETILASSALPTLFRAVEIDDGAYWDGLFSENPPVLDLLAGPKERTPDEVWVVRINPPSRPDVPRGLREIADRRNELSGNLSLAKDVAFIEQINDWLAAGYLPEERYKHVTVRFIALDRDLSLASKLNRDPDFLEELIEQGRRDATAFLADR